MYQYPEGTSVLDEATYTALRARYNEYEARRKEVCKSPTCATVVEQASLPVALTHDEISAVEVYEFLQDKPKKYFVYVKEPEAGYVAGSVGTWIGEPLGKCYFGFSYKSNMGDTRVPINVEGRNGIDYYGTYYKSAGDYARIKAHKGQK